MHELNAFGILYFFKCMCWVLCQGFLCFSREKGAALVSKLGKNARFVEVDIEKTSMLETTLEGLLSGLLMFSL